MAFAIVSWRFFSARIEEEERALLNFFKLDYHEYQKRVWSGVPFVQVRHPA